MAALSIARGSDDPKQAVMLPSIHEMFPEHMLNQQQSSSPRSSPHWSPKAVRPRDAFKSSPESPLRSPPSMHRQLPPYSLEDHRSRPRSSSLHQVSRESFVERHSLAPSSSFPDEPGRSPFRVDIRRSHRGLDRPVVQDHRDYRYSREDASSRMPAPARYPYRQEVDEDARHPQLRGDNVIQFPMNPDMPPTPLSSRDSHVRRPSPGSGGESDEGPAATAGGASERPAGSSGGGGKKHVCPTCRKRFNRPSSLRIHANTHTGATPFRCPYPHCGREFNVNSNMRRHYRNHQNVMQHEHLQAPRQQRPPQFLQYHVYAQAPPHFSPSIDREESLSLSEGESYDGDDGYESDEPKPTYRLKPVTSFAISPPGAGSGADVRRFERYVR